MKRIINTYTLLLVVVLTSCSDGDTPSAFEKKMKMLTSSPWLPQSVMHGSDGDLTSLYEGFSIAFTKNESGGFDGDYYVINGSYAFPDAFGKWSLSEDFETITLSNGQILNVVLTDETLTLDFFVSAPDGRVKGLGGHFTFVLEH